MMDDIVGLLLDRAFRLATRDFNGNGARLAKEAAEEILRLRAENEKLRAALINLYAASYDLPQTKECRLYNALRDADEVLKEAEQNVASVRCRWGLTAEA